MRVLGLDLGARRIGLAVSDPDGEFAFPAGALFCAGTERDLAALRELALERQIERIVVGLPLHLSGQSGVGARAARAFAASLARVTGLPVDTLDERWTTAEAERALQESTRGRGGRKTGSGKRARARRSGAVDAAAAALILRTYLARRPAPAADRDGER